MFLQRSHLKLIMATWVAMLMAACTPPTVSVQSRNAFASQFSEFANQEVTQALGDAAAVELCLPSRDSACVFVRGGREQPPCALNGCDGSFVAIEVRRDLLERAEVRQLLEQESARFCSYIVEPAGTEHTPTVLSLGCHPPRPPFRIFREVRPTLCILIVGSGENLQIVESYAVRDGGRTANEWCESIAP